MYRIILVDDEKLVLKSLQFSVDWEQYGFEIVGSANTAMEALDKIGQLKPDVVFTDIHMPDISGLELLQMIRRVNPAIYCVVISGYAEFSYVRKAMELESVGYCLKPFDYDEITKYLKKIKKKLDQDRATQERPDALMDNMIRKDAASVAYMEHFYQARELDFARQELFAACVMGLEHVNGFPSALSVQIGFQKWICLVRREDRESFFSSLRHLALESEVHAGYTRRVESTQDAPKMIQEAYRCAYQFFCEGNQAWLKEAPESWDDRKAMKEFQAELQSGEEGIRRGFDLLRRNFKSGRLSISAAVMLRNMIEMMSENDSADDSFAWNYDSLVEEYKDVGTMLTALEEQCGIRQNEGIQIAITNQIFRQIYEYVDENFQQTLTLSEIASRFYINSTYVSQLFKKELGKTFTEVLTEKRIRYACTLLKESSQNINEIAEQSGFKDYFYFSRVFRKLMQCTPTEYRAQLRRDRQAH